MYLQKYKRSKYGNKSSTYKGITYHSIFESQYAEELDLRLMAKDIQSWERQVKLDLKVNGTHIANYYIDFILTHNDDSQEYVEVKGMETALWQMKWKILEATFDDFKKHPDDRLTVIKQSSWGRRY